VTLSRRGRTETLRLEELTPEESAPILREYLAAVPVVRPFFEAKKDSPLGAFAAEAADHPVFQLERTGSVP
jgi:hypothetical protein